MGTRGPLPKDSESRTRRNATYEDGIELKKGVALPFTWPRASTEWDDATKDFYYSFKRSGMAAYMQQPDLQYLWIACDELAKYRASGRQSAMLLGTIVNMLGSGFGITPGERRRMHVELDIPQEEESDAIGDKVVDMKDRLKKKA